MYFTSNMRRHSVLKARVERNDCRAKHVLQKKDREMINRNIILKTIWLPLVVYDAEVFHSQGVMLWTDLMTRDGTPY